MRKQLHPFHGWLWLGLLGMGLAAALAGPRWAVAGAIVGAVLWFAAKRGGARLFASTAAQPAMWLSLAGALVGALTWGWLGLAGGAVAGLVLVPALLALRTLLRK